MRSVLTHPLNPCLLNKFTVHTTFNKFAGYTTFFAKSEIFFIFVI